MAKKELKAIERLDKCVAHLTSYSRQEASYLIKEGCVSVDGQIIDNPAQKINVQSAIVIEGFNDESVSASEAFKSRVYLLNKPANYICADRDKNHSLIVSLFKEKKQEALHSAGRLDVDTTGLIIVTDDGDLNHQITSPKREVSKLYLARLDKEVPQSAVEAFKKGIKHPEEKKRYQSAELTIIPKEMAKIYPSLIEGQDESYLACVKLSEGRYHEVKRLFEVVGVNVVELTRLAIGALTIPNGLALGKYVTLMENDIDLIFEDKSYSLDEMLELIKQYYDCLTHAPIIYLPQEMHKAAIAIVGNKAAKAGAAAGAAAGTAAGTAAEAGASDSDGLGTDDEYLESEDDFIDVYGDDESVIEDIDDEEAELEQGDFDEADEDGNIRIY